MWTKLFVLIYNEQITRVIKYLYCQIALPLHQSKALYKFGFFEGILEKAKFVTHIICYIVSMIYFYMVRTVSLRKARLQESLCDGKLSALLPDYLHQLWTD